MLKIASRFPGVSNGDRANATAATIQRGTVSASNCRESARRRSQVRTNLLLEGEGFEPSVPVREIFFSNPLIKWQRAAHNELCDRRNDQVLNAAKFKQGDGATEAGFGGIAPKNYWK